MDTTPKITLSLFVPMACPGVEQPASRCPPRLPPQRYQYRPPLRPVHPPLGLPEHAQANHTPHPRSVMAHIYATPTNTTVVQLAMIPRLAVAAMAPCLPRLDPVRATDSIMMVPITFAIRACFARKEHIHAVVRVTALRCMGAAVGL